MKDQHHCRQLRMWINIVISFCGYNSSSSPPTTLLLLSSIPSMIFWYPQNSRPHNFVTQKMQYKIHSSSSIWLPLVGQLGNDFLSYLNYTFALRYSVNNQHTHSPTYRLPRLECGGGMPYRVHWICIPAMKGNKTNNKIDYWRWKWKREFHRLPLNYAH